MNGEEVLMMTGLCAGIVHDKSRREHRGSLDGIDDSMVDVILVHVGKCDAYTIDGVNSSPRTKRETQKN